ncbi:MAG: cyclic-di-AMP receptor [Oscillospiraceae bacterium]|nr:cyclic-di-AMP receptor [Oscillospiraceae bacterium]
MKLILSIISHDDAKAVIQALTQNGFSVTKLATTGGFLMFGNVTILLGVDEDRVQSAIDIIKDRSHQRKQAIPLNTELENHYYPHLPMEVVVGGTTIFVLNIEKFERA